MKKSLGDRQCATVVSGSEVLTRLISVASSLSLFFSHTDHLLSLAAILPAW